MLIGWERETLPTPCRLPGERALATQSQLSTRVHPSLSHRRVGPCQGLETGGRPAHHRYTLHALHEELAAPARRCLHPSPPPAHRTPSLCRRHAPVLRQGIVHTLQTPSSSHPGHQHGRRHPCQGTVRIACARPRGDGGTRPMDSRFSLAAIIRFRAHHSVDRHGVEQGL